MLLHFEKQSCVKAAHLLEKDAILFSVLIKILQGECAHIFTDFENVIVCHSGWPYPVWVWCADIEKEESVKDIAECIKQSLPMEQGYTHILSHALLKKLRENDAYFGEAREKMGLLSYRLDELKQINSPCEGYMSLVREEEIPGLIDVWHDMHMEMEGLDQSREHCEKTMRRMVDGKNLFSWRVGNDKIVALTGRGDQSPYSKITSVYTLPEYRRKGYAINLVRGVTEIMLRDGYIPILYTDAGYIASNACYQKIGYRLVGQLTSIWK